MKNKRGKSRENKIPWFLVIVVIIIIVLLLLYVTADISEIRSCEKDSECIPYQISGSSSKFVCAQKNVGDSFKEKVLMFKYYQKDGIQERPENCVCQDNVCSLAEE